MKWFKHMSQSHTDEKLAAIISECGLEGYGFWWMLMEIVAGQCIDDKCSVTYTLAHWSRMLYCHHNKVDKYLGKLGVTGIVTVEYIGSNVRVTIPNLLKYRDEYSRKSGQKQESIRPKKENKKENKEKTNNGNKKSNVFLPPTVDEVKEYMAEINYAGDAQNFVDSNTAKGWVVGKNKTPIKDWKAVVRTWRNNGNKQQEITQPPPQLSLIPDAHRKAFERLHND